VSRKLDGSRPPSSALPSPNPVVHRAVIEVAQVPRPQRLLQKPDIMRRVEAFPQSEPTPLED
jgi:hypothetical protein